MSLAEIKKFIEANNNFAIIGHTNPDGDCIGSCLGLWHLIKLLGKNAAVMIKAEDYPRHIEFLKTSEAHAKDNDVFDAYISVDCAGADRLLCCSAEFKDAPNSACIDHHRTNTGFAKVNAVIPDAAAAGEIIYRLAKEQFGIEPKGKMAECIYTAIVSDSGGFKYSSTTGDTMRIGAALLDSGVDSVTIYKRLFDTYTKEQIDIISDVTSTLETYFDGKVAVISITDELLKSRGVRPDDADFLVSLPRAIEGVEVGVFFKKRGDAVKVSLRSAQSVDVSQIASRLGGGGHMRAAGITLNCNMEQAKKIILEEIEKSL